MEDFSTMIIELYDQGNEFMEKYHGEDWEAEVEKDIQYLNCKKILFLRQYENPTFILNFLNITTSKHELANDFAEYFNCKKINYTILDKNLFDGDPYEVTYNNNE